MRKTLVIITLLIAIVYACNQSDKIASRLLSAGNLPTQLFNVNIQRDTTLVTKKGAIIHIPQGALSSANTTVQLEVKEAYSMKDIIAAGLITQSNGQSLSSGGMIYINATGENTVKITKAISVATPTEYLQQGMQLFKGTIQKDNSINWERPTPLAHNKQLTSIEKGEQLFKNSCASCHSIDKELTGPRLAHTEEMRLWEGGGIIDEFIRNPAKVVSNPKYPYYNCLKKHYGLVMTPTKLNDEELDNLFAYIKNESDRLHLPEREDWYGKFSDSCFKYEETKKGIIQKRDSLIDDNGPLVSQEIIPDSTMLANQMASLLNNCNNCVPDKVIPESYPSVYYQFKVEAFGWYNIDMMLKNVPGIIDGQLAVRIAGNYSVSFNVFIIIPALKVYQQGGLLKDKSDEYGFYTKDGKLPLLPGSNAYIFALGEGSDEIFFGKQQVTLQQKQNLELRLEKVTREQFDKAIKEMSLDNSINIQVQQTKNADKIRAADKDLKNAEKLKPAFCDCDCLHNYTDSAK